MNLKLSLGQIPEPYLHLAELPLAPADMEVALEHVYRTRRSDIVAEARTGVASLVAQFDNAQLSFEEVTSRQEGLGAIATVLDQELLSEFHLARSLLLPSRGRLLFPVVALGALTAGMLLVRAFRK